MNVVAEVVRTVINTKAHKATKYLSDREIVRATRRLVRGKVPNSKNIDIILTIGRPNYAERKIIKGMKKANEPFPVRKVQIKYPPKRKAV